VNLILKLGILFLLGSAACHNESRHSVDSKKTTQITIETVKLAELDGTPLEMSRFKGKTVFINFWATWCKPCLQEMPSINRMMEKLKDKQIVFLFASNESAEQVLSFKARNAYPFHYVLAENPEALQIMALPTTFIFNAAGELVFSEMGAREWDDKANIDLIYKIANQQ